jgi:hypothetical protein
MTILTVDLASKFSAVCVMDEGGGVLCEFDSGGVSPIDFVDQIVDTAVAFGVSLLVIEDVPPNNKFTQYMTKPVTRLQGVIIYPLAKNDLLSSTVFVNPSEWQRTYDGVSRGTPEDRIEAARVAALALGYTPPDLVAPYIASLPEGKRPLKKMTKPLEKQMTDYIDAFLIARWALTFDTYEQLTESKNVQPAYI